MQVPLRAALASVLCAQQEVTGEEEPEEAPKAALGGLFGRAKKAAQDTTGEAQPEKKPAKALGGLFGRAKRATEEAIDEIESEPKPKPFAGLLGGTKKVKPTNSTGQLYVAVARSKPLAGHALGGISQVVNGAMTAGAVVAVCTLRV